MSSDSDDEFNLAEHDTQSQPVSPPRHPSGRGRSRGGLPGNVSRGRVPTTSHSTHTGRGGRSRGRTGGSRSATSLSATTRGSARRGRTSDDEDDGIGQSDRVLRERRSNPQYYTGPLSQEQQPRLSMRRRSDEQREYLESERQQNPGTPQPIRFAHLGPYDNLSSNSSDRVSAQRHEIQDLSQEAMQEQESTFQKALYRSVGLGGYDDDDEEEDEYPELLGSFKIPKVTTDIEIPADENYIASASFTIMRDTDDSKSTSSEGEPISVTPRYIKALGESYVALGNLIWDEETGCDHPCIRMTEYDLWCFTSLQIMATLPKELLETIIKGEIAPVHNNPSPHQLKVRDILDKYLEHSATQPSIYMQVLADDNGNPMTVSQLIEVIKILRNYIAEDNRDQAMAFKIDSYGNDAWEWRATAEGERYHLNKAGSKRRNEIRYWCNLMVQRITSFAKAEGSLAAVESLPLPGIRYNEVGYSKDSSQRFKAHSGLNLDTTNWFIALMARICRVLGNGHKFHQYVVFYIWSKVQASMGEMLFTRLAGAYLFDGGFNYTAAGIQVQSAGNISADDWDKYRAELLARHTWKNNMKEEKQRLDSIKKKELDVIYQCIALEAQIELIEEQTRAMQMEDAEDQANDSDGDGDDNAWKWKLLRDYKETVCLQEMTKILKEEEPADWVSDPSIRPPWKSLEDIVAGKVKHPLLEDEGEESDHGESGDMSTTAGATEGEGTTEEHWAGGAITEEGSGGSEENEGSRTLTRGEQGQGYREKTLHMEW